ncbi:Guanosine deaminase [Colletotrichum shisoi]|uniref:Guanosine deaminase n=1 Tax=Colletotrichum shisoi TaxID=2078593 RepID=A0A5Q4BQ84_9PEZI|nr:Guanosine deaminase [Colletotrichum shisoi]
MLRSIVLLVLGTVTASSAHFVIPNDDQDMSGLTVNSIPASKRVDCPFAAFGTIIVNHTSDEIVCEGANFRTGDPTIHGEISAINACTARFAEQGMTPSEIYAAWGDLSIYTNAESCPMCASAIRWAGFKEYVYGTTIQHNYNVGWGVMTLSSYDVFQQSRQLPGYQTVMVGQILTNETDPLFSWQYNASAPCPNECFRVPSATRGETTCSNITVSRRDYEAL